MSDNLEKNTKKYEELREKGLKELREKLRRDSKRYRETESVCEDLHRDLRQETNDDRRRLIRNDYEECKGTRNIIRDRMNKLEDAILTISGELSGGRRKNHRKTKKAKRKGRYSRRN